MQLTRLFSAVVNLPVVVVVCAVEIIGTVAVVLGFAVAVIVYFSGFNLDINIPLISAAKVISLGGSCTDVMIFYRSHLSILFCRAE